MKELAHSVYADNDTIFAGHFSKYTPHKTLTQYKLLANSHTLLQTHNTFHPFTCASPPGKAAKGLGGKGAGRSELILTGQKERLRNP